MSTGGSNSGSTSRRKGSTRRVVGRLLQLRPVVACCSAAVGLLLGAWVVLCRQQLMQTQQVHTRLRFSRTWVGPRQNATVRHTHGSGSSGSTDWSALQIAATAAAPAGASGAASSSNAQRPVNTLQLTVIQVADGDWQVQQRSTTANAKQSSSGSNGGSSNDSSSTDSSSNDSSSSGSSGSGSSGSSSVDSSASNNDGKLANGSWWAPSNSSATSSSDATQKQQQVVSSLETVAATPAVGDAEVPKVALLFMATDSIPNEPIWRAFFEAAAQFQLQPDAANAAAAAAQWNTKSTMQDVLGATPLHPPLRTFDRSMYPTYKIQHNLAPGAEFPKPRPKRIYTFNELQIILNERAAQKGINRQIVLTQQLYQKYLTAVKGTANQEQQQQQHAIGSNNEAPVLFYNSSKQWEKQHLQHAVDRLLHLTPKASAQQQQQQEPWNPLDQLSTVADAAVVEAELLSVLDDEASTTGSSSSSSSSDTQQQQQQHAAHRGRALHPALAQQKLFSVYVHTPDGISLPEDSMFSGAELPVRLNTTRGYAQHVLAEAAVLLLKTAMKDPTNTKFVLVSDSSIPLYPPQVLWAQLMAEPLSRLDACITPGRSTDRYRWRPVMSTKNFGPQHWRKSSQWFTLTRGAAMLAVEDKHVREVFHSFCYTNLTRGAPLCVSDEHYLASLMASYGLDNTTDCQGLSHYADWSGGGWHPKSFGPHEINEALVKQMRHGLQSRHPWDEPQPGPHVTNSHNNGSNKAVWEAGDGCDATAAIWSASTKIFQHISAPMDGAETAGQNDLLDVDASIAGDEQVATGTALKTAEVMSYKLPSTTVGRKLHRLAAAARSRVPLQVAASSSSGGGGSTDWIIEAGYVPLGAKCPLFARKFPASSVKQTLAMALSCSGLGFGSWCHQDSTSALARR